MKVEAEALLPVDPATAWRRLLAWEDQSSWMVDAVSVRVVTPHREGRGVRIAVRTRVLGLPVLTDVLEIVEWDPPRRFVMVRRGFVRGSGEWRLEPAAAGTRFVWTERLSVPVPLLGEVALLLYRPVMRALMRNSLANLARALR